MPLAPTAAVPAPDRSVERTLAERHRWGDASAFEEIYRDHAEMVYNLALRLVRRPRPRLPTCRRRSSSASTGTSASSAGRSSLKTWIYRITINHCRSRLARRRFATRSLDTDEPRPLGRAACPIPRRGPEERAMAGDAGRVLEAALAELPAAFREAVVLRDLEGLAYEEIAEVLGARIGTVRSRIARGPGALCASC